MGNPVLASLYQVLVAKWIGKSESTLNDPDLRNFECQDLDDIKAERNIRHVQESQPEHRSVPDESLLSAIHRIKGTSEFLASARLDLRKDKSHPIPANEVDLSATGSPEVPSKNLPTQPLQVECSRLFSPPPQCQVTFRNRRRAGRPVQSRGDDAGKVHAP